MTYYADKFATVHQGHVLDVLKTLPENHVHCVATSPPYYGLRSYKGEDIVWGDNASCLHEWGDKIVRKDRGTAKGKNAVVGNQLREISGVQTEQGNYCQLCNAWRGQLGNEPTVEMFICHLVEVMREVNRVLRKDGVAWLNCGDSWAGSGSPGGDFRDGKGGDEYLRPYNRKGGNLKPLDMCLVPSRLALALQVDGWYVRSMVIWDKPSCMPESVNGWRWEKHRVKVKGTTPDWLDKAVKESGIDSGYFGGNTGLNGEQAKFVDCPGCPKCLPNDGLVLRKGSWRPTDSYEFVLMLTKSDSYYADKEAVAEKHNSPIKPKTLYKHASIGMTSSARWEADRAYSPNGRNLRSVWTINTVPYAGAHFATFPPKLPETCIKAATSEKGCCPKCGSSWARVMGKPEQVTSGGYGSKTAEHVGLSPSSGIRSKTWNVSPTTGWLSTCKCEAGEPVPCIVLDPFAGAGTTGMAARSLGRQAILIEVSAEYCNLIRERLKQGALV